MEKIKNSVDYFINPIRFMDQNKKLPLLPLILWMILLVIMSSILLTNIYMAVSPEIKNLVETLHVEQDNLKIFICVISIISMIFKSFIGYILLACILKVVFIFLNKEVDFKKIVFLSYYISFLGLLQITINSLFSNLFRLNALTAFTNLSFLSKNDLFFSLLLQVLDIFTILQLFILYLFMNKIIKCKKLYSSLIVLIYLVIIFSGYFMKVMSNV